MKKIDLTEQDRKEISRAAKKSSKRHRKKPYQGIGNVKGVRETDWRCEFMKFPKDFEGKSVLDIGCNLGAMCYVAKQRGAGRVIGIDKNSILLNASSNVFARHNYDIDLVSYDLNEQGYEPLLKILGEEKFDYIFALAIYSHVHDKNVLWNIINNYCGDICWFEGHKGDSREEIQEVLISNLKTKQIDFIGTIDFVDNQARRPVFKCTF